VTVISAVLGDASEAVRDADTIALLDYGLAQLKRVTPVRKGERLAAAKVRYRESDSVPLIAARTVHQVVRRGQRARVSLDTPDVVEGPQAVGARVGTATVRVGGRVVARVPVVAGAPVPEVGLIERVVGGTLGLLLAVVIVLTIAIGSVLLAMARRRRRQSKRAQPAERVGAA
jgi:serine-type D-Ala-D-Ala carboxypeptidase (penicillin-binding protein 5/6)